MKNPDHNGQLSADINEVERDLLQRQRARHSLFVATLMRMGTAGFAMIGLIQEGEAVQWHKWQPGTLRVWSPEIAWAGFVQTSAGCCETVVAGGGPAGTRADLCARYIRSPSFPRRVIARAGLLQQPGDNQ